MPNHPRHLSTKSSTQMRRERRQRRSVAPAGEAAAQAPTHAAVAAPVTQMRTAPAAQAARLSPDRYKYVLTELRWIGAMVGVVAVILIVLSFVLPKA